MKRIIVLFCILLALLCSCRDAFETEKQDISQTENSSQEQQEQKIIAVSPLAQEDFLVPFEKYSWEKEHKNEYVVIHFTSNVVADRENPYDMQKIKEIFETAEVSTHYIIDRNGKAYCYIPETRNAWHAGAGTWKDDEKYTNSMNKYSVGIELAAIGSQKDMSIYLTEDEYMALDESLIGFTDEQYAALSALVRDICTRNDIPFDREHIIGHDEYNPSKNDPGELFDWDRLFN